MPSDTPRQQDERTRLLSPQNDVESNTQFELRDQAEMTWREWTGLKLESPAVHRLVISLIILDSIFVLIDLSYTFLIQPCATPGNPEEDAPVWLDILSHISLGITTLFLIEIPLAVWAFGFGFYNPTRTRAGGWHLLDATVIVGTFTFEVILRGKERELASLLILLRLWRLVKLVGGVAVGVEEFNEELETKLAQLQKALKEKDDELIQARQDISTLKQRLARLPDQEL